MTADGDKVYHYDALGRLTHVASGANTNVALASYRYDALGRLAMRITHDYQQADTDLYAAAVTTRIRQCRRGVGAGSAFAMNVALTLAVVVGVAGCSNPVAAAGPLARSAQWPWEPGSLGELLAVPVERLGEVDVARMNLLCAQGLPGAEGVDVDACLVTLDEWAARCKFDIDRHLYRFAENPERYDNSLGYFKIEMMITVLQQDMGVRYNMAFHESGDFRDAGPLFIHDMILGKGGGNCVSMPTLYAAVARRLGYPVRLVLGSEHVYCRWDAPDDRFNFEATYDGVSVFDDEHYRNWPRTVSQEEVKANHLLESLTPAQELAVFLAARGHCLHDNGRRHDAQIAYAHAHRLSPESQLYLEYLSYSIAWELRDVHLASTWRPDWYVSSPGNKSKVPDRIYIPSELPNSKRKPSSTGR